MELLRLSYCASQGESVFLPLAGSTLFFKIAQTAENHDVSCFILFIFGGGGSSFFKKCRISLCEEALVESFGMKLLRNYAYSFSYFRLFWSTLCSGSTLNMKKN